MTQRPRALLVAPPGPTRRSAVRTLREVGYAVRKAAEPYEGTALFVERPTDLVVLSLASFRRRDRAFVTTVRRRAPTCRILLLVPEGARGLARRALTAGADAWLPEPWHAEELVALARALGPARLRDGTLGAPGAESVQMLAAEVAHAINNPLQILSLYAETPPSEQDLGDSVADTLAEQVGRIRRVVGILDRFAKATDPRRREVRPGPIVERALETAQKRGDVLRAGTGPSQGPLLALDPERVEDACDAVLDLLAAHAPERPVRVRAGIHRPRGPTRKSTAARLPPALRDAPIIEIAVQAQDVHFETGVVDLLRGQVVFNHEETRHAHPGLALPAAVAWGHGGGLVHRPADAGSVLGLVFPMPR